MHSTGDEHTHLYANHDSPNHVFTLIKLIILQTNQSIESSVKWKDSARVSIHSDDIMLRSPIIKQHVGRHSGEIIPAFQSCFVIVSHPTTRTWRVFTFTGSYSKSVFMCFSLFITNSWWKMMDDFSWLLFFRFCCCPVSWLPEFSSSWLTALVEI